MGEKQVAGIQLPFQPPDQKSARRLADPRWLRDLALIVLVGVGYFGAARLGFLVVAQPEDVAVFWPAAGLAAGIMLALGAWSHIPCAIAIALATVTANLLKGSSWPISLTFALANAAESLVIARLLLWSFPAPFSLDDMPRVFGFMAATVAGCALSSAIAATGLVLIERSSAGWLAIWTTWFESDAAGVIAVAPLVLGICNVMTRPIERWPFVEGLVVLAVLIVAGSWIFLLPNRSAMPVVGPAVVVFPLLLWLAARTPPLFSAAASFSIAAIIVTTLTRGVGRFGDVSAPLDERVLAAQLAIVTAAFCALVLSALFEERHRTERSLRQREQQLYRALETGRIMAFEWLPQTGTALRLQITGGQLSGERVASRIDSPTYFDTIHHEDRVRVAATLRSLTPAHPSYTITYRYRVSADRVVWLEETGTMEFDVSGEMLRLTGLARDVTERVHADDRQRRLIGELNHRVKNVLNVITATIDRSHERHDSLEGYVAVVKGRIDAMTRTHTRLSRSGWSGVGLVEIVNGELAPHRSSSNAHASGPPVVLKPDAAQAMTLVLHELATNAVKYGALAPGDAGRVDVTWRYIGPEHHPSALECLWQETLNTPMAAPGPESYGTSMIRNLLRHELEAEVDLAFPATGARCLITLPAARSIDITH